MPTYEYECDKCGKEFEVFQSMKDDALKVCTCGKKGKVHRKIGSGAGLIFKGSGFYITDYKKTASSTSSAPSSASSGSDKPSSSKPEKSSSSGDSSAKKST